MFDYGVFHISHLPLFLLENRDFLGFRMIFKVRLNHKIQIKFDYGEIDIYHSWIMALFLSEDRDFKGFWMKIWNAGVSVITRSTFSSLICRIDTNNLLCSHLILP
jgi:hypothetical protein